MNTQINHSLILDKHRFREVMREAKDLIEMAKRFKYNLMHEDGLRMYDLWSPYVLDHLPSTMINAPGFKISVLQVMSIIMAMKGEKKQIVEDKAEPLEQNIDTNVINFLSYKNYRNGNNIYGIH